MVWLPELNFFMSDIATGCATSHGRHFDPMHTASYSRRLSRRHDQATFIMHALRRVPPGLMAAILAVFVVVRADRACSV
jgi:hypothetical protein